MDQITIKSLIPKFLSFYDKAKDIKDDETRFQLWKKHYNFAALPPVKDYDSRAKKLLDNAWLNYKDIIEDLMVWEEDLNHVQTLLKKVKTALQYDEALKLTVVYFVGAFENNAFVAQLSEDETGLFLPVETKALDIILAHELTHIVHFNKSGLAATWERTIASVILQEGLAMHISKRVVPGYQDEKYTEFTKGWLKACAQHRAAMLSGIMPYLEDQSEARLKQFTIGKGTTNHEREAYFVGWVCVEYLLNDGLTFEILASLKVNEIPPLIKATITKILTKK